MQVKHALTRVGTGINHDAKAAFGDAVIAGKLSGDFEKSGR